MEPAIGYLRRQRVDASSKRRGQDEKPAACVTADARLSTQIADLRTEQGIQTAQVRTEIAQVRTEIATIETRLIRWMVRHRSRDRDVDGGERFQERFPRRLQRAAPR